MRTLFIFFVFSYAQLFAQKGTENYYHHKVSGGIGLHTINPYKFYYLTSFSFVKSNKDELCLTLRYNNEPHDLLFTFGYDVSCFKKPTRFDLMLALQAHLNYRWNSDTDYWRFGPFWGLGLKPYYYISDRISTGLELAAGVGYQWAQKEIVQSHFGPAGEECFDCGIYYLTLLSFSLGYKF
jgi:hypothetical protein